MDWDGQATPSMGRGSSGHQGSGHQDYHRNTRAALIQESRLIKIEGAASVHKS